MLKRSLIAAVFLLIASQAHAAQMKLLVGGSMQEPFKEVGADFAKKTGNMLDFLVDTTGALQKRLRSGEKADIILVSSPGMDALEKEHLIMPGTRVDLASAAMGISVRAGAASPDLSTPEAFKKTMMSARSVALVDPKAGGTSGIYLDGLFQKMGIADEIKKKTVYGMQGSQVANAVADGRAEIGLTFISEMMPNKGVKIAGPLPPGVQNATNYTVAIPAGSPNPDVARAFIQAMRTAEARAAIAKAGLEPLGK
ncbi:MAG TPA: molybdate ABC transporter substrate-binding protein [Micropepsaceae bacterium]|jgi:molybdate transport system substrate-binding protein|nr:molybdate ABC transporter substrate-binding protein [Micropepsaceae bacterium]